MPPVRVWYWTVLLVFRPQRFATVARDYADARNALEVRAKDAAKASEQFSKNASSQLRRALFTSFWLVFASALVAQALRFALEAWIGRFPSTADLTLQVVGAGVLLWASLAKQGWNIQTFGGWSAHEQVDAHVFRLLYVAGTFLLVLSLPLVRAHAT